MVCVCVYVNAFKKNGCFLFFVISLNVIFDFFYTCKSLPNKSNKHNAAPLVKPNPVCGKYSPPLPG